MPGRKASRRVATRRRDEFFDAGEFSVAHHFIEQLKSQPKSTSLTTDN
jgi:hypothetical protein